MWIMQTFTLGGHWGLHGTDQVGDGTTRGMREHTGTHHTGILAAIGTGTGQIHGGITVIGTDTTGILITAMCTILYTTGLFIRQGMYTMAKGTMPLHIGI